MTRSPAALHSVDLVVETRGEVSLGAPDYARTKLLALLERLDEPVLAARVKLTQEANHAIARPSLAQAWVTLGGEAVRAHVAAATMREAVDQLQQRLRARIERVRHHRQDHRHTTAAKPVDERGWESPLDRHRPVRLQRGVDERRIVRHKSYSLARRNPWAAVFELECMDFDFHLFTDARTGRDSVVHRLPDGGGYGLLCSGATPEPVTGMTLSRFVAPELTVGEAVERLDVSGEPFVFFAEPTSGRGNLLYHRYDGNYGLITPVQD